MRTLLLRALLILVVIVNQSAIADDSVARMQRYSKINQLFDSPFYSIGIRDISSMMAVDLWDFNLFSDCIIQNLKDSLKISENSIFLNNTTKTLAIRNADWLKDICPFPVKELVINFIGEKEDAERSL